MPGSIKIDDGSGNYTILTNAGSLGSDKTITIPNETGTAALTSGVGVIQTVVQLGDNSGAEFHNTSEATTSLVGTITPTSTSSKIMISLFGNINFRNSTGGSEIQRQGKIAIYRNDTASEGSSPNGTNVGLYLVGRMLSSAATSEATNYIQNGLFLDSPATTSATTYKLVTGIQQTEIKATYQNTSSYPSGLIIMELAQ